MPPTGALRGRLCSHRPPRPQPGSTGYGGSARRRQSRLSAHPTALAATPPRPRHALPCHPRGSLNRADGAGVWRRPPGGQSRRRGLCARLVGHIHQADRLGAQRRCPPAPTAPPAGRPARRPRAPATIAISRAGRLRAASLRSQNSTLDAPPHVVRRRLTPDTALRLLRTARKSIWTASRCKAKRRRREGLKGGQREHARHGGRTHLTPPHRRHLGCPWPQPAHSTRRTGQRSV